MRVTPSKLEDLPDLLTVDEAACWARIGRRRAYELVRAGELPSVRVGRSIRVPKRALARYMGVVDQSTA